jgi:photosystem II stability/assembly factor-like uncharacterized protein
MLIDFAAMWRPLIGILLATAVGFSWEVKTSGAGTNLRGISVFPLDKDGASVVWASGSNAAVLRSGNSGRDWERIVVPDSAGLDFRGVQVVGAATSLETSGNVRMYRIAETVYVMSSGEGEKSRIYKTSDSGKNWELQYQGKRKEIFLDALACADATHCFVLSDPVDGKFVILRTEDGRHWSEMPSETMPAALEKEGAFAASNSCLMIYQERELYFATGGPAARVFHSVDLGRSWMVAETPVVSGKASAGIFSLARHGKTVVAVGGDYQDEKAGQRSAAVSLDEGKTWRAVTDGLDRYRSGVAVNGDGAFVAVGPTGTEISRDGLHWEKIDSSDLNVVGSLGNVIWAGGPKGTVVRLVAR